MPRHFIPRLSVLAARGIHRLRHLHDNDHGEIPVGQMLVIGAVVIPLVIVLVIFRVEVATFLFDKLIDIFDASQSPPTF